MPERAWWIDVCRTCERLARWPFCEHRPRGYQQPGSPGWYVTVRVTGSMPKRKVDVEPD